MHVEICEAIPEGKVDDTVSQTRQDWKDKGLPAYMGESDEFCVAHWTASGVYPFDIVPRNFIWEEH